MTIRGLYRVADGAEFGMLNAGPDQRAGLFFEGTEAQVKQWLWERFRAKDGFDSFSIVANDEDGFDRVVED